MREKNIYVLKFLVFILLAISFNTNAAVKADNELVQAMLLYDNNEGLEKKAKQLCAKKNSAELQKIFADAFIFAIGKNRLNCVRSLMFYAENSCWDINILGGSKSFIAYIIGSHDYDLIRSILQKKQQQELEFGIKKNDVDSIIAFIGTNGNLGLLNDIKNYLTQDLSKYLEEKSKSLYNWKILPCQKIKSIHEPLPDVVFNCDEDVGVPGDKVEFIVHWIMTARNGYKEEGTVKINLASDFYIYNRSSYNGDIFFEKRDAKPRYLDLAFSRPEKYLKVVGNWLTREARIIEKPDIINIGGFFSLIFQYFNPITYAGKVDYQEINSGTLQILIKKDKEDIDEYTIDVNNQIWELLHARRNDQLSFMKLANSVMSGSFFKKQ